jgi:hypothetical protein
MMQRAMFLAPAAKTCAVLFLATNPHLLVLESGIQDRTKHHFFFEIEAPKLTLKISAGGGFHLT